ncbi:adenylate/guanylate cyclase domain-containing protein [Amorphus orientalis]|uniref:Adenylate cyclase n=1 Tax=Amorphus orientalis TaxID=649198 RepID=A0AAE3VKW7_9HYPH|nr:adenylate/guanylate cyclase domain-containing protein [Amorphus orientalis]MDQ0313895.1 adenylate cyclase [Amorphus orientalis]
MISIFRGRNLARRSPLAATGPGAGHVLQRLRLASGLVLFAYVFIHFVGHALGIVSLAWMDAAAFVQDLIWRSVPGTVLLYGALATHVVLVLIKVARRRTIRMPVWEALQIILGLLIPFWLVTHVVGTRGLEEVFGIEDTYRSVLTLLWPDLLGFQTTLMLLVWVHSCIGLHFWLRLKTWYATAAPWLLTVAIGMPLLASWGWIEAARRLALAGERQSNLTEEAFRWSAGVVETTRVIYAVCAILALVIIPFAAAALRRGWSGIRVTYPGDRVIYTLPGPTLLEISRSGQIPHASVCGGRARCSTCRTRILAGGDKLPPPRPTEARVLERIDAAEDVRLACQVRPRSDISVQPLFPTRETSAPLEAASESYRWGVEQRAAILFVDMRGFTALSEQRLPYDVVYLLNEYLNTMSAAVRANGGYVDKYIGDAVMAIFGISEGEEAGCGMALSAAGDMVRGLERLNRTFAQHLSEPLRIGIGIHAGPVVLGRVGAIEDKRIQGLTALGDTVNTASRLEAATKELGTTLVFSEAVAKAAAADVSAARATELTVRGRVDALKVYAVDDPTSYSRANVRASKGHAGRLWRWVRKAS